MTEDLKGHVCHLKKVFPNPDQWFTKLRDTYRDSWEFDCNNENNHDRPTSLLTLKGKEEIDNAIIEIISKIFKEKFPKSDIYWVVAFANYYRDGNDYCRAHQDDVLSNQHLVTVSLGATRKLVVSNKNTSTEYELESGDIFFFDHYVNNNYSHRIDKDDTKDGRISVVLCAFSYDKKKPLIIA